MFASIKLITNNTSVLKPRTCIVCTIVQQLTAVWWKFRPSINISGVQEYYVRACSKRKSSGL